MPYIGGDEYNLIESDKVKIRFVHGQQQALTNIYARMASLKDRNNRGNCSGDVTHEQPIGKQISYRPYNRIASFNGYFLK